MCSSKAPVAWCCLWTTPISFSSFSNIRLYFFTTHTYIYIIHSPRPQLHPFQAPSSSSIFCPAPWGFHSQMLYTLFSIVCFFILLLLLLLLLPLSDPKGFHLLPRRFSCVWTHPLCSCLPLSITAVGFSF